MALKEIYEKFLVRPRPEFLAPKSSLHYVSTVTTHTEPENIVKHLTTLNRSIKKHSENILSVVEGSNSLCVDVETKLEFLSGGGPYLLSLDDNFYVDRTVTFPMVHIVQFDSENKISQIRLYWDQGSLLKQLEVIGPRNRTWPISDGSEQMRLITSSISAAGNPVAAAGPSGTRTNKTNGEDRNSSQVNRQSRNPHGALSLFENRNRDFNDAPKPAPRGLFSAKPAPRDYNEIFGDEESEVTPPKASKGYPETPRTNTKKYNHFEFGEGEAPPPSTSRPKTTHFEFGEAPVPQSEVKKTKTPGHFEFGEEAPRVTQLKKLNPKRASQFEFGEAPVPKVEQPISTHASKKMSQWDFEDFNTPEKPRQQKVRGQDVRHFGWSDDEVQETPAQKPRVARPRRDCETHFKLQDKQTPIPEEKRAGHAAQNKGLYDNNLYDESGNAPQKLEDSKGPLSTVPNGVSRKKDFDPHWVMTDEPIPKTESTDTENKHIANDRMKAVKMMESSWDTYDEENQNEQPAPVAQRANRMSRNVNNQRHWGFGDD